MPAVHIGNVESCVFDSLSGTSTVNFNSPAILNWRRGFNIRPGQHLRFSFNDAAAGGAVLNRDLTRGFTNIFGRVSSNGRVVLIKPGGTISIQAGAVIEADGGFLASTLQVSDEAALLRGDAVDFQGPGSQTSAIENRGTVRSANGNVVLISGSVNNIAPGGRLLAPNGSVRIGAGTHVSLFGDRIEVIAGNGANPIINSGEIRGHDAVEIESAPGGGSDAITNDGNIRTTANGSRVFLRARDGGGIVNAVNGLIETDAFTVEAASFRSEGQIVLPDDGSNPAAPSGSRQFPRLSDGGLASTPTSDFRLSRLSFSHLNGLESKTKPTAKPTVRLAPTVAVRGAANADTSAKKPAPKPKKIILRRGSFFGKKTS